jgi:fatty acid desaturase
MSASAGITNQLRLKMRDEARRLSEVSLPRSLLFIATTWSIIILGILLPVLVTYCFTGSGWVLSQLFASKDPVAIASIVASLLVSMLFIAARQHALAILMHEGVHFTLAHDRSLNELVSNWFCAFPLGMVTSLYRRWHLAHHAAPNTQNDPDYMQHLADDDFHLPMLRRTLLILMLKDLAGVNLPKWLGGTTAWLGWPLVFKGDKDNPLSARERYHFVMFWASVAAVAILTGIYLYVALVWFVPILTLLPAFARVRTIAEHNFEQSSDELDHTRHVDGRAIERFFIAPFNINYHIAHHYFPSVPFYNLPTLHRALLALPEFRQRAVVLSTYFGRRESIVAAIAPSADR